MKSDKTICIFFDDLKKSAQKRIIETELLTIGEGDDIKALEVTIDCEPYGYDPDLDMQEMLQDVHATVSIDGEEQTWIFVWDCMEREFVTCMEDNQL